MHLLFWSFSHSVTHSFICSFTLFIHSPSSLLAITVNKALRWALSESRETIHTPSPSGAHRLEETEKRGMKENTIRVKILHVIKEDYKAGETQRGECEGCPHRGSSIRPAQS